MTTSDNLRKQLASGDSILGAFVYWTNLAGCRVDRALFKMGMKQAQLDQALSADPKPEKTLNDAAKLATRRQPRGEGSRVKLKVKAPNVVTYAVQMRRDATGRMNHLEEATISVARDGEDPAPFVEVDPSAPLDDKRTALCAQVVETFDELRRYVTTDEVSSALVASMAIVGAISLRTGAYFVPADELGRVRALQAFLADEVGVHLAVWDVARTTRNAAEAKVTAEETFTAKLRELVVDVEQFTASIADAETVQARSIVAHARRFRDLDAHVSLYADVLGDHVAMLQAAIATAKDKFLGVYLADIDDTDIAAGAVDVATSADDDMDDNDEEAA